MTDSFGERVLVIIDVFSEQTGTWIFGSLVMMSAGYRLYSVGDSTAPCGIPCRIRLVVESLLLFWLGKFFLVGNCG